MSTYRARLPHPTHKQQFAQIPLSQLHYLANSLIPQFAPAFDQIQTFALFVGYPRSGHSLVGALLDAHPHAIIGHEVDPLFLFQQGFTKPQILTLILANSHAFAQSGRGWTGYSYAIPNSHQGKFTQLQVIGDKMGSRVTTHIRQQPQILNQFSHFIGLELKLIHHLRNPFDIIGTLSQRRGSTHALPVSISLFSTLVQTISKLDPPPFPLHTDQHEHLIQNPSQYLTQLLNFLHLQPTTTYLDQCSQIIFPSPQLSRHKVTWPKPAFDQVHHLIHAHSFLHPYQSTTISVSNNT